LLALLDAPTEKMSNEALLAHVEDLQSASRNSLATKALITTKTGSKRKAKKDAAADIDQTLKELGI